MRQFFLVVATALLFCGSSSTFGQNALHFDGSNDYVQTTFPGVFGTNNRTFEAWVYVDIGASATNLCITDYGQNLAGSRNTFSVTGTRGLTFISGGTNANISSASNVITEGQWTHVAFVLSSGTGYLYVNGTQVGTGSLSSVNTPTGNQNLRIGERVSGGSILFEGAIDEVRIWDVARTPTQIANFRTTEFCSVQPNLVAYYTFNQGIAGGNNSGLTSLHNAVLNANGTLSNFSLSGTSSNWVTGAPLTPGLTVAKIQQSVCDSMVSPSGFYTWTTSGIYFDTVANANSCDSIMRINLTVNKSIYDVVNDSVCEPYTSPSGKHTYTVTGKYFDTTLTAKGCLHAYELNLVITLIDTNVTEIDHVLTADEPNGDTYRWLDCANGYAPIGGASSRTYSPDQDGAYAVKVTKNNCADTSACIDVVGVGISSFARGREISLFPNPADHVITVTGLDASKNTGLEIRDLSGRVMRAYRHTGSTEIDLVVEGLASGVYLLRISTEEYVATEKVAIK